MFELFKKYLGPPHKYLTCSVSVMLCITQDRHAFVMILIHDDRIKVHAHTSMVAMSRARLPASILRKESLQLSESSLCLPSDNLSKANQHSQCDILFPCIFLTAIPLAHCCTNGGTVLSATSNGPQQWWHHSQMCMHALPA